MTKKEEFNLQNYRKFFFLMISYPKSLFFDIYKISKKKFEQIKKIFFPS